MMTDDTRANGPRGPRKATRPRILLVSNPSNSSSDEDKASSYTYSNQPPHPGPSQPYGLDHSLPPTNRVQPPPLTTKDLPEHRPYYPSSRSNPSNPALSSPSSTSSHVLESTPPPSTPGQSQPSVDLMSEGTLRPEHATLIAHERSDSLPSHPSRSSPSDRPKPQTSHSHPNHIHQLSSRPATSPTLSTPDSFSTAGSSQPRSLPKPSINILVTSDSDSLIRVDITGFRDAAFIRERIFSKLQIYDEDQARHSIYRTEVGQFAIGEALGDEQLYELCRDHGDTTGSVKLLVSPSHARVHEPTVEPTVTSPVANTIIPPVLPQHDHYAPLKPKRRPNSRSRRGSFSSAASERYQADREVNTGYEASVSDDLDHDRDTRRPAIRPLPPGPSQRPRSPRRPPSPSNRVFSPDRAQVHSPEMLSARSDRTPRNALPTPPALSHSPQSSRFQDTSAYPPWGTPTETTPERGPYSAEKSEVWKAFHEREMVQKDKEDRRRNKEHSIRRENGLRRPKGHHDTTDSRREAWTIVPHNVPTSDYAKERSPATTRQSPSTRGHGSPQQYSLSIPPKPLMDPPAPPVENRPSRGSNKQRNVVPPGWAMAYKPGGSGKHDKTPVTSPSNKMDRLLAKSMGNLHEAFKTAGTSQIPPSLQPGRSRPTPPQLPLSRPNTSGSMVSNGPSGHSVGEATSPSYREPTSFTEINTSSRGGTQSPITAYHQSRQANTSQYSASSSNGSGYLGTSTQDPYPRPRSALGNDQQQPQPQQQSSGSPYRARHLQSPSGPDFPSDSNPARSSPLPPPHYYPASMTHLEDGCHTLPPNYTSRPPVHSHSHSDGPSTIVDHCAPPTHQVPHPPPGIRALPIPVPTAPRSPIVPVGSSLDSRDTRDRDPDQFPIQRTLSSLPVREDDVEPAHTLGRDDHARYMNALAAGSSTMIPIKNRTPTPPRQQGPELSSSVPNNSSAMESATILTGDSSTLLGYRDFNDGDSDGDEGTIWLRPPTRSTTTQTSWGSQSTANGRPVLAPISTDNSPSVGNTALPGTAPNLPAPPNYIPDVSRMHRRQPTVPTNGKRAQDQRTSRFDNNFDYTWAPRPPVEEVVERIHEYFPEHDVDKPVIEAASGGASPTSAETPTLIPLSSKRSGHKKSIRYVAAEHKRRTDRTSRMEPANVQNQLRKRNTKVWGVRAEEVTSDGAKDDYPAVESSPGGVSAKPIFRWVRGELIGKGTYGKVYLALNANTGEMIAVKQVEIPRTDSDINDARQSSVVEALKLESETLKDLDHPNIVQYLGFEETPAFLSIFLEYVPGGSIASCLRKHGKFDEEVTKSFTGQILSGLEYLHSKGILHRDLKADNILVETSGVCKISDFGISKRTEDINMADIHTSMQGTVFWMAPEVINSKKGGYNSKIDIWSVGCVVFEMWTGQRPWMGHEAFAVLLQLYQTRQGPALPENFELVPLADDFRKKCFAMDPDERPSASELQRHPYLELQPDWTFNGFK